MALMMEVKGVPPRSVLGRATRRKVFFDDDYRPIIVANSKGKMRVPNGKNLADMINTQDADFVDFIDVSVSDAALHPTTMKHFCTTYLFFFLSSVRNALSGK